MKHITLPAPTVVTEGMTAMQAMQQRHTTREYADTPLTQQQMSDMLWCAYGVNRPDGKRTVPSAWGLFPLVIFAVTAQGVYRYNPADHSLDEVAEGDYRAMTGHQPYVATAAVNLVYFADRDKMHHTEPRFEEILQQNLVSVAALDAAHCTENVYLYAAQAGLGAVVRLLCDGAAFRQKFALPDSYAYVVAQTIGVPAEA